jgi:hypothetical protein
MTGSKPTQRTTEASKNGGKEIEKRENQRWTADVLRTRSASKLRGGGSTSGSRKRWPGKNTARENQTDGRTLRTEMRNEQH